MGYDLHITRASHWADDGPRIALAEWEACVAADAEMEMTGAAETPTPDGVLRYTNAGLAVWKAHPARPWFDYRDGRIVVKNPDDPTIAKMVAIAQVLRARVQGDDGETYPAGGGAPVPAPGPSLWERLGSWLRYGLRPRPSVPALPFGPGDRVRSFLGQRGRVVSVDLAAEHGLGLVRVRFDDGRELSFAAVAHGLERDDEDASTD